MATAAQRLANHNYRREKRDQTTVEFPKGKREVYKQMAAELGMSLTQFIQCSIDGFIANFNEKIIITPKPVPKTEIQRTADQEKLLADVSKLSPKARRHLLNFLAALTDKN